MDTLVNYTTSAYASFTKHETELMKLISRRHPEYDEYAGHWKFLALCYRGGRAWFDDNIFAYYKEGSDEYVNRKRRAYRFNHTREIVDLINKYLFRADIVRNDENLPESVKTFWKDVDGDGTNIDNFMQVVSQKSSIYGCPWIVVDSNSREASGVLSVKQAKESDHKVYAYVVSPEDVLDFSWNDDDGMLNWILIREWIRDDEDPFQTENKVQPRYRLWSRDKWMLYKAKADKSDYEEIDSGINAIGVVPAFRADNMISTEQWTSPALINDIAYLDRSIANYLSNLDAIIQDQTFSQLAIPAQGILPGSDEDKQILEMGTKRIFTYDGEAGVAPMFLSPDPRQAQLIVAVIQQIINEIYHSVGLAGERTKQDNSKGIDNSSGVAKSKDFERVNSLLCSKANALNAVEYKLTYLVSLYAGEHESLPDEYDFIVYPKTFDVRQLHDEFDIAMRLSLIDAPEVMRSEQMMAVVEKLFPGLSPALREQMKAAVKDWQKRLEERAELMTQPKENGGSIVEEAKRDRETAGQQQSDTKTRQDTGKSSAQDTGQ